MEHLDEGIVQALLHRELPRERSAAAEQHLAECPACEAAVQHARAEDEWVLGRLALLDVEHAPAAPPAWQPRVAATSRSAWWRRAAGLLAVLGGSGVLWALPAVRSWVLRAVARQEQPTAASPAGAEGSGTSAGSTAPGGISIVPGSRVAIEVPAGPWEVRARLEDRLDLSIVAGGGRAAFESAEDRVRVRPDSGVSIQVNVPRTATWVEVVLAGRRVLLFRVGSVTTSAPRDSDGWYQLQGRS